MPDHLKWFAALLLLVSVCRADGVGGDVGVATDEVYKGLSQSDHQLSAQLDLHYTLSGWYAGVTAVEVRRGLNRSVGAGLIGYLGYEYRIDDDWAVSLAVRHYDYPGYRYRNNYDFEEGALSVSWRELIVASVMASPDVFSADLYGHGGNGPAYTYEIGGRLPLAHGFTVNSGVGYYDLRHQIGSGYAYWSAGISKPYRAVSFDLRYVGTDHTAKREFGPFAENRLIFSALYLF
jgi:uncharacterized protein (TIGR02001 family)